MAKAKYTENEREPEKTPEIKKGANLNMCYVCGFKTDKGLPRRCPKCNVPLTPEKEAQKNFDAHNLWKKQNNL